MPLKLYRRPGGRVWYLRGTVRGQHCYETAGTEDRSQAEAFRSKREAELYDRSVFGARAVVSFQRAALSYLEFEARSARTEDLVQRLVDHFGATLLSAMDQSAVEAGVTKILGPGVTPATKIRQVYVPVTAILHHAAARGWCGHPSFDRPTVPRSPTRWLTPAEALALMVGAAPHLRPLLHFMLCTGARLSEALELDWNDVDLLAAHAVFRESKNGKDRVAALTPAAVLMVANLPTGNDRAGRVFRRDDGEPYADNGREYGGQIKTAWGTACRRAGLEGVTPHDLRHTWATWFYGLTKDLQLLRDEGGWHSVTMVERYAHLMPTAMLPEIAAVWGPSHPKIGAISASVQSGVAKNA